MSELMRSADPDVPRTAAGENGAAPRRRMWATPELVALPPLTELTLATGGAIEGECPIADPSCSFF